MENNRKRTYAAPAARNVEIGGDGRLMDSIGFHPSLEGGEVLAKENCAIFIEEPEDMQGEGQEMAARVWED